MNLKDFTKETLVQIVNGVLEANEELKDKGAYVSFDAPGNTSERYIDNGDEGETNVIDVDFDVAITATEAEGANGGLKVASIISFGGSLESKTENQTISRIKYKLPLVLVEKR